MLRPERQSVRMSTITNDGLTQSDTGVGVVKGLILYFVYFRFCRPSTLGTGLVSSIPWIRFSVQS